MVARKTADIDAFIARPDPARRAVLVFGPDAGLVAERVRTVIAASVDDPNDPFALARLDGEEITADPSRLTDEALTMPLFSGRRAIWVKAYYASARKTPQRCPAMPTANAIARG